VRFRGNAIEVLRQWLEDEGLTVRSDTNYPRWDGDPLDYDYALDSLCSVGKVSSTQPND
jgi:hypothetical protein